MVILYFLWPAGSDKHVEVYGTAGAYRCSQEKKMQTVNVKTWPSAGKINTG